MKASGEPEEKEFKMKEEPNIQRTKLEVQVLAFSAEKAFRVPSTLKCCPEKVALEDYAIGPESRAS